MPHLRKRHIENLIAREMKHAPCLGVMLFKFQQDTGMLRSSEKPLALDEIQKCPMAFDALKFEIDQRKRPGQFLVSGVNA